MLDQNTDRMWYVIGAVLIGAAIIMIANGSLPQMFASVTESFEGVAEEATTGLKVLGAEDEQLGPEGDNTMTDGIAPSAPDPAFEDYLLSMYGADPNLESITLQQYDYAPELVPAPSETSAPYLITDEYWKPVTAEDMPNRSVEEVEVDGVSLKHFGNDMSDSISGMPIALAEGAEISEQFNVAYVDLNDSESGTTQRIVYYPIDSTLFESIAPTLNANVLNGPNVNVVTVEGSDYLRMVAG